MTFITLIKHALLSSPPTLTAFITSLWNPNMKVICQDSPLWKNFRGLHGGDAPLSFPAVGACASDLWFKMHFDFSCLFCLMTLIIISLMSPACVAQAARSLENSSNNHGPFVSSLCGRFYSTHIKYWEHKESKPSVCRLLTRVTETHWFQCHWRLEGEKFSAEIMSN